MDKNKRKSIIEKCCVHVEQMDQAGEQVSTPQLADFAYHQLPLSKNSKEENKKQALDIATEALTLCQSEYEQKAKKALEAVLRISLDALRRRGK